MSNTNYDASFCATIPLHNTNAIQPHAALFVVNVTDFRVIQISSNVDYWLGISTDAILNQPLENIVEQKCMENIRDKYARSYFKYVVPEYITLHSYNGEISYLGRIHEKENYLLIEVEFVNEISQRKPFVNAYQKFQEVAVRLNQCTGIDELIILASQEIKRISGFDKVMIYSFDEKWNGLVIAEAMEKGMESYLGLKFPASDVPKQARDLYLRNPYRIIPDRKYKRVPLIPELNPVTNGPTNLTDVKSRSVLDVHLEYLGNMNVEASMSTRIIHNESLWGLIACHHREAKLLSFEECAVFEMMSNVISSKLSSLTNQFRANERTKLNALLREISSKIILFDNLLNVFKKYASEIKTLLSGDGLAICWDGEIVSSGTAPTADQIKKLLPWLRTKDFQVGIDITSLPEAFEPATEYASVGSGILILPIQPYDGNFILAFKMEAVKTVSWGGNPENAITFDKNSTHYHPRNSFAIWKETVRLTSTPWTDEQLIAAERFRNIVVENTLKQLTMTLEQKVKERTVELASSNQQLSDALDELQELTHITSHDLHEPVRKIVLFAGELDKSLDTPKKKVYVEKILKASKRISHLITDLVNISLVRGKKVFQTCDLQVVIDKVLTSFAEPILQHKIKVAVPKLPTIDAMEEQIEQLFYKIIDNAIKFRSPLGESLIEIKCDYVNTQSVDVPGESAGRFLRISVIDSGVGFDDRFSDKLFKVFETLHPGEYEGTGSSLAIAKRIVESHGGKIFAYGKVHEGAVFTIVLPVSQQKA